jgi:hypothetical protein
MSFSPLRVFMPASLALLSMGLARYCYTFWYTQRFTNMSHLMVNSAVIVFMLGLIAEQIASLRLERGERLYEPEDAETYAIFKTYSSNNPTGTGSQ